MSASKRIYSNPSLLDFLKNASGHARFRPSAAATTPAAPDVFVLGNPSSDLDSIISAIVYSYFASVGCKQNTRSYIPLINLPDVKSGAELRRLRPEFVTALGLAAEVPGDSKCLEESVLTIADLRDRLHEGKGDSTALTRDIDVFMVDWNALLVTKNGMRGVDGISGEVENVRFSVIGCIDHHDDEQFVPDVQPRVIQTGVGSCTSLVVRELRAQKLWVDEYSVSGSTEADNTEITSSIRDEDLSNLPRPSSSLETTVDDTVRSAMGESQVAKLALAAILADTANMMAESKVSDIDREAVSFLEDKIAHATNLIRANSGNATSPPGLVEWNRQSFYDQVMHAKSSSVENLTIDEVLGRDYKEWIDIRSNSDNGKVKVGICNVVKPLEWVISKAAGIPSSSDKTELKVENYNAFFTSLGEFAQARELDVVALMTVYTTQPDDEFHRELIVWTLDDAYLEGLRRFEASAIDQFGLHGWVHEESVSGRKMWTQKDISKSRKQVAPLLRKAMAGTL